MTQDLSLFVVKEIKHRLPAMEVRYKTAARTAQVWIRDSSGADGKQVLITMASIKGQLYKVLRFVSSEDHFSQSRV